MKSAPENGRTTLESMKAVRVHQFGGIEAMAYETAPRPVAGPGQVLVQVHAAGVGPWDAWVRSGRSVLPQPLPLILGSDVSGVVAAVGPDVAGFGSGDEIFGVTNSQFTGAYAEFSAVEAGMIAPKPSRLSHVEAASVPVVACTAWQMLFDEAATKPGQRVLIHGGAGGVGAYAVQFARRAGAEVWATAHLPDLEYVAGLGASHVIDARAERFERVARDLDVVVDLVGGETLERSFATLKPGGVLVSAVAKPVPEKAARFGIRASFILVGVTTERLTSIAKLLESGEVRAVVGEELPLAQARLAHEMLAGKRRRRGKIVLVVRPH